MSNLSPRFLIPTVDSWFGIVTTPVEQTQLQIVTPPKALFGRGVSVASSCPNLIGSYQPCNIESLEEGTVLVFADEGYKTLNGVSDTHIVREYSPSSGQVFYFLGDVGSSKNADFKANTLAVSTQCEPISKKCGLADVGETDERFNCTPSFAISPGQAQPGPAIVMSLTTVWWGFNSSKMLA